MPENINIIIVDDESEARELLITLLDDYPNIIVTGQSGSVDEALALITANPPDIVFLDIHMPKKNGFDLANAMRNLNIKSHIIFVTAYDQYAIQAFKHAAFDYLLKPINEEELKDTILRFQSANNKLDLSDKMNDLFKAINGNQRLRFTTRSGYTFINLHEIVYLEAEGNYTTIYLSNGKDETITQSLGQIEEELSPRNFFRVNRSVIINLKYIVRVNKRNKMCHISVGKTEMEFYIPSEQIKLLESLNY
jgi:two-component system LytT family response regulator